MPTRIEMMMQRVNELDRQVSGFGERFDAIDQKLTVVDERFDAIDQKFKVVDERFDAIDRRFDGVDRRLDAMDTKLEEMPTRSELRAFVQEMTSQVKTAAEGYGATLEALQRDLRRLSSKVTTKDRHRDLVSTDHGKRISALERR